MNLCGQNNSKDSIISLRYRLNIYDTVTIKDMPFKYVNQTDVKGNVYIRDSVNYKPGFIYYFTSFCPPCSFEIPMLNKLYEKFQNRIDFLAFTPIPEESVSEFYPESKTPKFPVISMPPSYFKGGFPDTFILDKKNIIVFRKYGGTTDEKINAIDYQILYEWCEKILNK
jgi:thiol-disulfide isomerase/thioredoxin